MDYPILHNHPIAIFWFPAFRLVYKKYDKFNILNDPYIDYHAINEYKLCFNVGRHDIYVP